MEKERKMNGSKKERKKYEKKVKSSDVVGSKKEDLNTLAIFLFVRIFCIGASSCTFGRREI